MHNMEQAADLSTFFDMGGIVGGCIIYCLTYLSYFLEICKLVTMLSYLSCHFLMSFK